VRGEAVHLVSISPEPYHPIPGSILRTPTQTIVVPPSFPISSICGMSQSSSESFESIFNAALEDYAKRSGTRLDEHHPLVKQLENCNSVDSISSVIQEHARRFRKFRGEDGILMRSLKGAVQVLYTLSTSAVLGESISIVCPMLHISILFLKNIR